MSTTEGGAGGGKDLSRAVAFLTLPKVQRTPESARVSFLQGKGFTAEEIAEAQRQANELLEKRKADAASADGSTFGGGSASALPWPLTRVPAAAPGKKASARVTVGGLGFVSLASEEGDDGGGSGDGDGEAAAAALLGKLDVAKEDVGVVMLVVGPGQAAGAHRALDAWVDPAHLPVQQVVEQGGGAGAKLQLFAVVRAR